MYYRSSEGDFSFNTKTVLQLTILRMKLQYVFYIQVHTFVVFAIYNTLFYRFTVVKKAIHSLKIQLDNKNYRLKIFV